MSGKQTPTTSEAETAASSWLVLGLSGTGKTIFAKASAKRCKIKGPTVVLNGAPADYPKSDYTHKDPEELASLTRYSCCIWDDLT